MRKSAKLILLFCLTAALCLAAEGKEGAGESSLNMWKWANFLVLVGGLGYLAVKSLPAVFAERSQSIVKDMAESDRIRRDAEARAAEVDRRLAGLEAEIAALRIESKNQSESETRRLADHTAAEIAKIQAHSEREIAAAGKAARLDLKRYAAELAIGLAEKKVRAHMTPATQDSLVRAFVHELK